MPGLRTDEARRRLAASGPNELAHEEGASLAQLVWGQLDSPLVWLLAGAAGLSAAVGEGIDAAAIGGILGLNAVVGVFQEYRAEAALSALREMTSPRARVLRDGRAQVVAAREVVVGDVLLLEPGDVVAADARVVEAHDLAVDEAVLTGESEPVRKGTDPVSVDAPLAERRDHVWLGTSVARGAASAEVVATGMATQMGRVSHLLATAERAETPLQVRLRGVSRVLMVACLAVVAVVAALGLMRGTPWLEVLLLAVSLAVAAVPEGLPAAVTIALALGVQRMSRRRVLVRRLPAVETLGCATVICTDKTGTLTGGHMRVRAVEADDPDRLLYAAAACCDAELGDGEHGVGDATEVALLLAARERGIERATVEAEAPRTRVEPFSSETRRMVVERADGRAYLKGAPEVVIAATDADAEGLREVLDALTARALRVLAVAEGPVGGPWSFLGLVGMADPPRPESAAAVAAARRAGLHVKMITGDQHGTARAIGRELGIDDVHARAAPEDKIDIVRALKADGQIVAMTGDGVNDAPALREAHIGIAMGRAGTEVSREAADMVLTDDDFASIVEAIRQGRGVYDNLRKTLEYLLAGNAAELAVVLVATVAGLPPPLLPLQLLWINLATDGPPALALAADHPEPDVLDRAPRDPDAPMLDRPSWRRIAFTGALDATLVLGTYGWALGDGDEGRARTLAFTVLVFAEVLRSLAARSPRRTAFAFGLSDNPWLPAVVLGAVLLQVGILSFPATREILHLAPLSAGEIGLALALGAVPWAVLDGLKIARRFRSGGARSDAGSGPG